MDRIDIHIEVPAVPFSKLSSMEPGDSSDSIKEKVQSAREIQLDRFNSRNQVYSNAQMQTRQLKQFCKLDKNTSDMLKTAMEKLGLSARAYDRILKVSRTIADLAGEDSIKIQHVSEAIQYRSLDRQLWLG